MIVLDKIFFKYPDSEFKLGIDDLKFSHGSKTAIIGTSGYGKTTMLNLIAGISKPLRGSICIEDRQIDQLNDRQRRNFRIENIGFIFQDFKLIPYLNVWDNILLPFRINKALTFKAETRARAREIASILSIEDKLNKYPGKLSQGERQRVAICRALLNDPGIILADEPTGNLDPDNKHKIMEVLFEYVSKKQSTLITVTHDHELLKGFDSIVDFKNLLSSRK